MDSCILDQADKSSPETLSDSSLSPESPDSNDIFGEPLVHPRVGDEYQVQIPCIRSKSELNQLMMNPADSKGFVDSSRSFLMGLPLPVMWVSNQATAIKGRTESLNNSHAVYANGVMESEKNVGTSQVSSIKEQPNVKIDASNQTYRLVPGQPSDSWSEFEVDCFLLGLYIFGKNLLEVMKFMERKGLGQILAYYYGRFYGSSEYRRWLECRKMRNRKCILGHRFFTGYRQHELFARLSPRLSEESQNKFMEVCRAFFDGKTSLDEYVSSLKALVGIRALVEAVGIGKGKRISQHSFWMACSSLTCEEIVKYLTGDFRLSKARSNDLFWEAVWPRLLARGWHSEQPRGDGYMGSRHSLVFLMPGVKKFSRRKLSKGAHYFDSVSDVLAKVASDPELLVLDTDEAGPSSSKVENGWPIVAKSDDDQDSSDHERHCYLKPRVSSETSNVFKFTIVDTSLANEDNPFKVRELRSLPHEAKRCLFRRTDLDLEVNTDTMRNGFQSSNILAPLKGSTNVTDASERMPVQHGTSNLEPLKKPADCNLLTDHKSRTIKHQFSRRIKPGPTSCSGSATKRRRLSSCVEPDVTCVLSLPARSHKKKAASFRVVMTGNAVPSKVSQSDNVKAIPSESAVLSTPDEIPQDNCLTRGSSDFSLKNEVMPQTQQIFDLNVPQVEPESDDQVNLVEGQNDVFEQPDSEKLDEHTDVTSVGPSAIKGPLESSAPMEPVSAATVPESSAAVEPTKMGGDVIEQQPRRQSTRNRPLTTKALEALEIGFLNPVRQNRKRSPSTAQEIKPKRSRQPRNVLLPPSAQELVGLPETSSVNPVSADENFDGKTGTLSIAIPTQNAGLTTREMLGLPEKSFSPATSSKEMFT
ncbi:Arginine-glutamic acid dipeptide repeats protein [Bienertia sinuspersici]